MELDYLQQDVINFNSISLKVIKLDQLLHAKIKKYLLHLFYAMNPKTGFD